MGESGSARNEACNMAKEERGNELGTGGDGSSLSRDALRVTTCLTLTTKGLNEESAQAHLSRKCQRTFPTVHDVKTAGLVFGLLYVPYYLDILS